MTFEYTVRGLSSRIIWESGSGILDVSGRLRKLYGLLIVESPARGRYSGIHANQAGNHHENGTDHRLLVRLRSRDRAPLPFAGLERRRDHANAAPGGTGPVGAAPHPAAR